MVFWGLSHLFEFFVFPFWETFCEFFCGFSGKTGTRFPDGTVYETSKTLTGMRVLEVSLTALLIKTLCAEDPRLE